MLRLFAVSRQYFDRLPSAGLHDGSGVVASKENVLRRVDAHGVAAEGVDVFERQAGTSSRAIERRDWGGGSLLGPKDTAIPLPDQKS